MVTPNPTKCEPIPSPSQFLTIPHKIQYNSKQIYKCKFCNKEFNRKDNLNRHLDKYCKIKQDHYTIQKLIKTQEKNEKKLTEKTNELLEKEKQWKLEKEHLMNQIELLITKVGNNNNNTNIQQNIILNNFGEENIEYLTDTFFKNLIKNSPYEAIPKLIEKTHFNKNHPENTNMKITNRKEPYIHIYKNQKWLITDKKKTIQTLVDKNFFTIDDKYETLVKRDLPKKKQEIYKEYRNKMEQENNKDVIKKTELVILNNS